MRRGEALGGALRVVPIALRDQRPGVDQLALLARRGLAAVGADDHQLGEGDGGADAVGMLVDQRRIEAGRAEGFGEAVHQVQLRLAGTARASGAPAARADGRRCWSACAGCRPRRPPVLLGQLEPQRRHAGEHGDVMTSDRPDHVARQEIVEGDRAAARRPGREQLVLAIVERQRQDASVRSPADSPR